MKFLFYFVASFGFLIPIETSFANEETAKIRVDLPILDMPFNQKNGGSFPSMSQSLAVTRTYFDLLHLGLEQFETINPRAEGWDGFWGRLTYATADILSFYVPGGSGWLHEEWHRAVMSKHGISSTNDINKLKFFSPVIAVSNETDEDLARLKESSPEDQVRLAAAGMEAEHSLVLDLEKDIFFREATSYRTPLLWILQLSPTQYLAGCASSQADKTTDEQNKLDGTSIKKRDFIGLDCNGWIRDLSRPKEPYADRGVHPSGVGVDRYTTFSELTRPEKDYLKYSRNLSFLNFVDPFLFRKNEFKGTGLFGENEASYNLKLRHDLASFGNSVSAQLFYKSPSLKVHSALFAYNNKSHWFPGFEVELFEVIIDSDLELGLRGQVWQQPKDFLFETSSGMLGALAGLKLAYRGDKTFHPYLNVVGKTKGWVSGIVEQDRSLQTILGLEAHR